MHMQFQQVGVSRRRTGRARSLVIAVLAVVVIGGAFAAKGSGLKTKIHDLLYGPTKKPAPIVAVYDKNAIDGAVKLTTDDNINFQRVELPTTTGNIYTCVQIGPDGQLYASTIEGLILRFPISADGTLGTPATIDSLQKANNGHRLIIGFCFEPGSTPDHRVIWVDNGYPTLANVPDFTGRVTRISDPELSVVHDVVTHLPRSVTDHQTNQPRFGPDGALYISQGCNTAYGGADATWGNRPERKLNGTILRLDVKKLGSDQTIDALTPDGGGTFDPAAPDSPLTIYACGIRNAYSLVWTTDGRLYIPTNGSSAGGNTPAGNGVPALTAIPVAEDDWLFRVIPGRYYGHPNPQLGHYVLNGGNPGGKKGPAIIEQYPVGTQPDPLWTPAVYDFGPHVSANGVVEYLGNAFNGRLNHSLIVCRFNAGSDLAAISQDSLGEYTIPHEIAGSQNLNQPLDVTEDVRTGFLYVSEYGAKHLTLMRPTNEKATVLVSDTPHLNENQQHGQTLFQTWCVACHGMRGQGIPNLGLDLTTSKFVAGRSDEALAEFIRVGRLPTDPESVTKLVPMPPNGGNTAMDDQGRKDVVEYIRLLCAQAQPVATTSHEQTH
jgi:glucose/arabinose dehydrogenase